MTFTRLLIPGRLLEEAIGHVREALPNECCGLLAGRVETGVGVVTTRFTVGNDLASPTGYLTNARDLFAAFRAMRTDGTDVLAVYHSHPTSEPVPSRRDVDENTYGETAVHLIVGFADAKPDVRAWWLTEAGYRPADYSVT
jgi:proteasome lid subunit RPN8/RPN11